jgi:hypothetical protein
MKTKEWLEKIKKEKPHMNEFITKLERFITDSGLNNVKFEEAVQTGLTRKEEEIIKSLTPDKNDSD